MPSYRAFFFDAQRHITDCREFDADNHDLALRAARQWSDGLLIEVWQGGEMIGTLAPASANITLGRIRARDKPCEKSKITESTPKNAE